MKKYNLSEIKNLVKIGAAVDITNEKPANLPRNYEKIGYSSGVYGISGGLIQDESGTLYAITARNSTLFRIF